MSNPINQSPNTTTTPAQAPARRKGRRARPRAVEGPAAPPTILDLAEAAQALRCSEVGLRARLRRGATRASDGTIRCELGPGVFAFKLGQHWRVRFDAPGGGRP